MSNRRYLIGSCIGMLYLKFKLVPRDKLVPRTTIRDLLWQYDFPLKYSFF